MNRPLAAALSAAALTTALLAAAPAGAASAPAPALECGGTAADWADQGDLGGMYVGRVHFDHYNRPVSAGFLVHLTHDRFRLRTDEANGTGQWEIRRYFGDPSPSVLFRSTWGATVLSDPRCEDPSRPTRVTSTTATVEDNETGRLTRAAG
ncbi:hypothetical protein ACIP93_34290 [Streptomyces sp. NPDC088745]|uniref:hypothetical protein n=1 Tax=Streptomyces sp. NPDC088745 TaxID=3365884 RepID=UPI0037FDC300